MPVHTERDRDKGSWAHGTSLKPALHIAEPVPIQVSGWSCIFALDVSN